MATKIYREEITCKPVSKGRPKCTLNTKIKAYTKEFTAKYLSWSIVILAPLRKTN